MKPLYFQSWKYVECHIPDSTWRKKSLAGRMQRKKVNLMDACLARNSSTCCCAVEDSPTPLPFLPPSCGRSDWGLTDSVVELVLACLARNSSTYCCAVEDRRHKQSPKRSPLPQRKKTRILLLSSSPHTLTLPTHYTAAAKIMHANST